MMSKVGVISCAHAHWLRSSRDGRIVPTPEDIPAAITMKDAYELLLACESS